MIVKFCKCNHNPFESKTEIQLCTLSYYKSTDNDFIRDIDEGQISRTYHPSSPTAYTGDEIGKIFRSSISGTGTIRFKGNAVKTTNPIPNAYIFCTSRLRQPTKDHAAALGYDSFYVIKDPKAFCQRIAGEMQKSIPHPAEIVAFHGSVIYQDDKAVKFSDLPAFHESHKVINPCLYLLKRRTSRENPSKVYFNDYEYRFVFIPVNQSRQLLPLTKEFIRIDPSHMMDVLDAV